MTLQLGQITRNTEVDEYNTPKDPWKFATNIARAQDQDLRDGRRIGILFNKGRYFEMTIHDRKLRASIAQAIKSKIKYNVMIVDKWTKLEPLVKAFNKRGYFCNIDIDWI